MKKDFQVPQKYLICHNQQLWNRDKKSKEMIIFSFLVC